MAESGQLAGGGRVVDRFFPLPLLTHTTLEHPFIQALYACPQAGKVDQPAVRTILSGRGQALLKT